MILTEKLAEMRYASAQRLKPEIYARMERQIAELRDRRAKTKIASSGMRAQSFDLATSNGGRIASDEALKQAPLIVSFYRGTWCSFCSAEMLAFAEIYDRIVAAGATYVAVSPERPELAAAWAAKHALPFPIAFDEGNKVAERYGLVYDFTDDARDLYATAFDHDIAAINGDGKWRLPMPARFTIDRNSVIREAEVDADFRERPEPSSVFTVLETIAPRTAASTTT